MCYPDQQDVSNIVGRERAQDIWEDVALAVKFLAYTDHRLHWLGKHSRISVSDLKKTTEKYIGRKISADAFQASLRMRGLAVWNDTVKFSPLDRLGEFKKEWAQEKKLQLQAIEESKEFGSLQ